MYVNGADLEARFNRIESLIATENAETRRHFDVVAEGLHDQIKLIAEGHSALTESISDLRAGFERLETGQGRLELRQLSLESRQGALESRQEQLEKAQKLMLNEVRLLASRIERSHTPRPRH